MERFARWTSSKLIDNHADTDSLSVRYGYGALEGWTSIVVNGALFVIKLLLGLSIQSVSLVADAVHTLADTVTSVVVIIGFRMAKKPSDKEHPFGHGRFESVAALIVALLLFQAAFELLKTSAANVMEPSQTSASLGVIAIIVVTIGIKEFLARFSYALGDIIDSAALRADAVHHRSDVFATALVVVALVASRFGYARVDGAMGILVSAIIAWSAYHIAREAVAPLLGEPVSEETLKRIEGIAKAHPGVLGVHDIIFHQYGRTNVISLHVEVSANESPFKAHALAEAVEEQIVQEWPGIAVAHVDPLNTDHPQYGAVEQAIAEIVEADDRVYSFHDLRLVGCGAGGCNAVFDIVLKRGVGEREAHDIVVSVKKKFSARFPKMRPYIKAEPKYAYTP